MVSPLSNQTSFSTRTTSHSSSVASRSTAMTSYSSTTSSRHPYSPRLASPLRTVLLPLKSPSRIASATSTQPPLSAGLLERLSELRGLESKTPRQMDIRLARRLMQLHRTASGRDKWYRHPNFKDANSVLDNISRGLVPGTPALVLALITQFHASVSIARPRSTNILKSMRDRDQTELKSRILAQAAENCTDEIMYILALYADATAVSEALPVAIVQRQSLKVMILMAKGADASGLCELFLQTVESGPEDLVDALLEDSDRGACQNCRNLGMVRAAMFRQKSKAALLLRRGADVSFDNASALFAACRRGMQPLAIHMVFSAVGSRRLDARLLDQLAGESYALRQYRLLEACLQMGARGHATDRALIKAVLDRQSSLVGLLARHGADLSHDGGSPVQLAVQSQRPQLLATLLRDGHATLRRGIIGAAVSEAMKFSEHQMAKEMTELLLKANIHRDSVNEALILVLSIDGSSETLGNDQSRAALAHLLITKGQADLNVNGGVCLGMALNNGWLETVRQLLHPRAPFEALSNALRDVMTLQNPQLRLSLLACLTEHIELSQEADADVKEILMSTALQAAAGALLPDVVQFLISSCRRFSEAHLSAAWESATSPDQDGRWLSPDGLGVLHILLEQGVSDEHIANSFCVAVTKCHREAMRLLFFCVKTEATFSKALHSLAESQAPPFWCLEDNLWLVGDLLASGCDGLSVNKALLVAVEACAQGIGSETVVEAILTDSGRADINFQDGEALKLAIGAGRISLLNLLLSGGNAQRTVLTQAFASLITTCLDETTMVHLLDALQGDECEDDEPKFDINITLSRGLPSLAACLNVNPGHAELVRRLIELGCHTEAEFQFDLYREDGPGEEPTTVLLWACQSLGEGAVSAAVIETLIAGKANINFTAPVSQTTPLLLASKSGRGDIATKLVAAKATVTARDYSESTALFYASRAGDVALINELKWSSHINDGSLQQASRNLHSHVVKALLEANHSVNSPLRNKTALQELCLHSDGSQSRGALEDTIQALNDAECNVWADHGGRSALFLALDNLQSPVEVTGALLRVFTWEYVNDRRTVFKTAPSTDGNKLVFSPTMYLDSKYYRGKREYVSELRELLYSAQAIDRCYMEIGPGALDAIQPKGAVNVPIDIAEEDERRRAIRYVQRADAIEARLQRKTESQKAASDWATRTDSRIDDQHEYQLSGVTQQQKPSQPETTSTQKMSIAPRWHAQQEQQVMVSHQNRVAQQRATSDLQMKALHRKQAVIVPRQRTEELRTFAMFSYAPKRYHS